MSNCEDLFNSFINLGRNGEIFKFTINPQKSKKYKYICEYKDRKVYDSGIFKSNFDQVYLNDLYITKYDEIIIPNPYEKIMQFTLIKQNVI